MSNSIERNSEIHDMGGEVEKLLSTAITYGCNQQWRAGDKALSKAIDYLTAMQSAFERYAKEDEIENIERNHSAWQARSMP